MSNKTVIITGGNTGIGKAIAIALATQSYHVVITSRNENKGRSALDEIRSISGNGRVDLVIGDLSDIKSTKELARNIMHKFPDISILINNAGTWPTKLEINTDGLEIAFMVNHMAPFILCHMLLPLLTKNRPARIVNVNAGLYSRGKVDIEKTPYGKDFGRFSTYMNTKLCNIFFTQKFSDLIQNSGVTINAVHPGVFQTNLVNFGILGSIYKILMKPPEIDAQPSVWLATSPEVSNVNGRYFDLCIQKPFTQNAINQDLSNELWDLSMKFASL